MSPEEPVISLFRIFADIMGWKANWVALSAAHFSIDDNMNIRVTALDQDPELAPGLTAEVHLVAGPAAPRTQAEISRAAVKLASAHGGYTPLSNAADADDTE